MAKVYTGRDGALQLAGTTLAKVVNFQLSSNLETLETTTLNEHIRVYVPGVVGYSGSATLLYYKEDDGTFNTTNILNKLYKTGNEGVSSNDTVELTFRWIDGTDNNDIKLTAYITSASIGAATGDIVRAEIAFQGTGVLSTVTIS
ncbi:MAG: hypothetical protein CMC70_11740 [Flavobacteriaceae bacterium]|nr:hypothetical protein [Flavobacteriaceae bacterium]|tara:strand:+ start:10137 stop:10571 length:435 start_codon:yes stop_codon:yes gene_type:complete